MFDLAIHKKLYRPTEAALAAIAAATQQCPCCPRPWSSTPPPTAVVPFSQRHGLTAPLFTATAEATNGDTAADAGAAEGELGAAARVGPLKMVLIVRADLRMSAGKAAVQCSHATLGCFQKASAMYPEAVAAWLVSHGILSAVATVAAVAPQTHPVRAGTILPDSVSTIPQVAGCE